MAHSPTNPIPPNTTTKPRKPQASLTTEDRQEVVRLLGEGKRRADLARQFGVSRRTIDRIAAAKLTHPALLEPDTRAKGDSR